MVCRVCFHFKAHYERTRPSSVNYKNSFRDSQFGKTYQEELNEYWNTKEILFVHICVI